MWMNNLKHTVQYVLSQFNLIVGVEQIIAYCFNLTKIRKLILNIEFIR
jgi:hypothetical protein